MRIVLPHERPYPDPVFRLLDADPGPLEGPRPDGAGEAGGPDRSSCSGAAQPDDAGGPHRGRKIPCTCVVCGTTLRIHEMDAFVAQCEALGKDPIAVAFSRTPEGIPCTACSRRALVEHAADTDAARRRLAEAWLATALSTGAIEDEAPARARMWAKARGAARPAPRAT
jgi:hypothetical protein